MNAGHLKKRKQSCKTNSDTGSAHHLPGKNITHVAEIEIRVTTEVTDIRGIIITAGKAHADPGMITEMIKQMAEKGTVVITMIITANPAITDQNLQVSPRI